MAAAAGAALVLGGLALLALRGAAPARPPAPVPAAGHA
jgi:hypothetical protein